MAVQLYTHVKKLIPQMLNEQIEHIEIHQAKKLMVFPPETDNPLQLHWND
ncbi:MAG: DUF4368 domain-containing protein [Eubacterium sp.]|nr:DUF4368 domain-containing protein [Eubacterium sp.]